MDIKIDIKNLTQLSAAFARAPGAVRRQLRLALSIALRNVQTRARRDHKFRSRSGNLERSIRTKITSDWPPEGRIYLDPAGTMTDGGEAYGTFQHEGTKAHFVGPKNRKALRWASGGGFAFSKGHNVRGISADPFIDRAGDAEKPNINAVFDRHIDAAIREAGLT
jgi:hypothetical protein